MIRSLLRASSLVALAGVGLVAATGAGQAETDICTDCLQVRVGPPVAVRGPFPDELDAPFTAIRLDDGTLRGFSANGTTYVVDGSDIWDMKGPRRPVLEAGPEGSINDCGRWLTSTIRVEDTLVGLVHQERQCNYQLGRTDKSTAIATSDDDGLSWTDLGTVISGTDSPQPDRNTGEGDCSMVDGVDGYLYAYCMRNTDWQTIVARAPVSRPTEWRKFHEGAWTAPGLGGDSTDIGFVGTGVSYLVDTGWIAAVATDPWFGGVRLSLSEDKLSFRDLDEPLITIDESNWMRPTATDLVAYPRFINPGNGSNAIGRHFVLSYIYVPPGLGFESRYLVHHEVSLSVEAQPVPVQVGMALTRWSNAEGTALLASTGPITGVRLGFRRDALLAYMLTRAPDGVASIKYAECVGNVGGEADHMLVEDGNCAAGYRRERTAGWLLADAAPDTVPVYRCRRDGTQTHFAASAADCDGLGQVDTLLGYGLAP